LKQNKILITGAAGFIGFHLCRKLIDLGYDVVGLDNINSYYDKNLKFSRLSLLGINSKNLKSKLIYKSILFKNFTFYKIDICDYGSLSNLFEIQNFEYVINLAAQAGVRYSIENPKAYLESNIHGFFNILECSRKFKINHLVYASSSSVYGNSKTIPFKEDRNVDRPVSFYAATKKK
jgi:UDP-glucuronate 4-epimerase